MVKHNLLRTYKTYIVLLFLLTEGGRIYIYFIIHMGIKCILNNFCLKMNTKTKQTHFLNSKCMSSRYEM